MMRALLPLLLALAAACSGGTPVGGPEPHVVTPVNSPPPRSNAVDILFAIDDSPSMADKQRFLADAVPELLSSLAERDVHVGFVASSLGGRGGDQCTRASEDARAHLLGTSNIADVGESGCAFSAQLESVYRFLVQPDPYESLVKQGDAVVPSGVDYELLRQRRDFLRPNSLLVIVMLTDGNESSVAPGAFGGRAWLFEDSKHVRPGTSSCATNPADPACMSCYLKAAEGDPACSATLDDATDPLPVRFVDMKRRFGIDPRYPVARYVRALTKTRVPSRDNEFDGFGYVGDAEDRATCVNPIFATDLPTEPIQDTCGLTLGPRTPDRVVFALVGGIPWQLLTTTPNDLSANAAGRTFKSSLAAEDWTMLLGADPERFDATGQHPLMRESLTPRTGAAVDGAHDREWDTKGRDLQYACTFELPTPRDCAAAANANGCDCATATDSPLCSATQPSRQVRGKAYPSLLPLRVAKALGDRALVGSACPVDSVHPTLGDQPNPVFGYRPTMRTLVERVKTLLPTP